MDGGADSSLSARPPNYIIRPMTLADYQGHVLKWIAEFHWELGLRDFQDFTKANPGCYLTGVLDGTPIASINVTPEGPRYSHMALFIVDSRYRRRGLGYGKRLFEAAMERVPPSVCLGLDSTDENASMYQRKGFTVFDSVVLCQYSITIPESQTTVGSAVSSPAYEDSYKAEYLSSKDTLEKIISFDRTVTSLDRGDLFRSWFLKDDEVVVDRSWSTRCAVCLLRGSTLVGFGVRTPMWSATDNSGPYTVGPICCEKPAMAGIILKQLVHELPPSTTCFLFTPSKSKEREAVLEACGWKLESDVGYSRMHLCRSPSAQEPTFNLERYFASYTPDIA